MQAPGNSAEEHHLYLVKLYRVSNRIRREFIATLLSLAEQKLYLALGSPSIVEYAERHFSLEASQTYESLRVGKALRELSLIATAFDRGEIGWTAVKHITKVAREKSEESWLQFAREHTTRQVEAEVKDAEQKGRDRPRKSGDSMPSLKCRLLFELAPEEHDLVSKALGKITSELGEKLGGGRLEPREALLFMARRMLETELSETPRGRTEKEESVYTILYHSCPDCRKASVQTTDGPVDMDPAALERIEVEAEKVHIRAGEELTSLEAEAKSANGASEKIDKPNTPTLRKKVLLRDSRVCANPSCRAQASHSHHIKYRGKGGRTHLMNTTGLCSLCHALVHLGHLKIEGNPIDGLSFSAAADTLAPRLEEDLKLLSELGVGHAFVPKSEAGESRALDARECDSTRVESQPELAPLAGALGALGFSKAQATERLKCASKKLSEARKEPPTEEDLLREALKTSL